jgi:hypothetical protein
MAVLRIQFLHSAPLNPQRAQLWVFESCTQLLPHVGPSLPEWPIGGPYPTQLSYTEPNFNQILHFEGKVDSSLSQSFKVKLV